MSLKITFSFQKATELIQCSSIHSFRGAQGTRGPTAVRKYMEIDGKQEQRRMLSDENEQELAAMESPNKYG